MQGEFELTVKEEKKCLKKLNRKEYLVLYILMFIFLGLGLFAIIIGIIYEDVEEITYACTCLIACLLLRIITIALLYNLLNKFRKYSNESSTKYYFEIKEDVILFKDLNKDKLEVINRRFIKKIYDLGVAIIVEESTIIFLPNIKEVRDIVKLDTKVILKD